MVAAITHGVDGIRKLHVKYQHETLVQNKGWLLIVIHKKNPSHVKKKVTEETRINMQQNNNQG